MKIPSSTEKVRMAVIGSGRIAREWLRLCLEHPHIVVSGVFTAMETPQHLSDYFPELHANLLLQPLHTLDTADHDVLVISETIADLPSLQEQWQYKNIIDLRPALEGQPALPAVQPTDATLALPEHDPSHVLTSHYLQSVPYVVYAAFLVLQPLVEYAVPARGDVHIDMQLPAGLEPSDEASNLAQLKQRITRPFPVRLTQTYSLASARAAQLNLHFMLPDGYAEGDILAAYRQSYTASPFIRLVHPRRNPHNRPDVRFLLGSNLLDIGFSLEPTSGRALVRAAFDLYGKGSVGTMLQSFNLSQGWQESAGLHSNGICFDEKSAFPLRAWRTNHPLNNGTDLGIL